MSRDQALVMQSDHMYHFRHTLCRVSYAVDKFAYSHNKPSNTKQMKMFIFSLVWFVREIVLAVALFLIALTVKG